MSSARGENVGTHTVRFDRKGRALFVESRFELAIKILFIPVYSFSYLSTARWRDDTIEFLDVDVDDNGELFYLKAWREEDATGNSVEQWSRPDLGSNISNKPLER